MLKKIFVWIYCLDLHEVLILLSVFTGWLYIAQRRWNRHRFWKSALLGLLILWGVTVISQTIFLRSSGSIPQAQWQPLQSYADGLAEGGQPELLRSNLMNTVLFFPGGQLFVSLLPARWKPGIKILTAGMVFVAMSVSMELTQYHYGLGIGQTDDIIHNVLGAVWGAAVILLYPPIVAYLKNSQE